MKKHSFYIAFLTLIGFLFVLVACSDDKGDDPPPSKPSSSSNAIAGGSSSSTVSSSSFAGNPGSSAGSSSSLAGSSSSGEGGSSSSLTGSSNSEDEGSSSSQGSVASSSSEGATSFRIPGATAGATLVTSATAVGTNIILAGNTQVTDVCFDVDFTSNLSARKTFMLSCQARTSPPSTLSAIVGYGGKCYKSDYPSLNNFNPIRIPVVLDSEIAQGAKVEAKDVCISFSQQITHTNDVLTCGVIDATVVPPSQSGNMSGAATLVSCPWLAP